MLLVAYVGVSFRVLGHPELGCVKLPKLGERISQINRDWRRSEIVIALSLRAIAREICSINSSRRGLRSPRRHGRAAQALRWVRCIAQRRAIPGDASLSTCC
jgi:hypothetical protein